jgi:hypothetical protein
MVIEQQSTLAELGAEMDAVKVEEICWGATVKSKRWTPVDAFSCSLMRSSSGLDFWPVVFRLQDLEERRWNDEHPRCSAHLEGALLRHCWGTRHFRARSRPARPT